MNEKILCFFTNSYPCGYGEEFIENELNFIAPYFDKVYLFHKQKSDIVRETPQNVELIYIDTPNTGSTKQILKQNFFLFLYLFFHELFLSRQKKLFLLNLAYNLRHISNCIYYSKQIKNKLNSKILKNALFYSYWFFDWNFSLSVLKYKKQIIKNITRAHGFDLYENNGKPNYLPMRKFCLKYTNKVFTISKMGETYLKNIYPQFSEKISCAYLGTKEYGLNPISTDDKMHIVSCSGISEVKRINLIIEILKNVKQNVLWTHIGEGALFESIKQKAKKLPKNISVDFKGRLTQKEIFNFYAQTPIDVFINISISEGLPVSIMEAISFGIPVIATDVGGTSEIINEHTGMLIEKDFNVTQTAQNIVELKSKKKLALYREGVRNFWKKNFNADTNYQLFIEKLIN